MRSILVLAMLLSSCGQLDDVRRMFTEIPDDPRTLVDEPELWTYADRFEVEVDPTLIIGFQELESPQLGLCYMWFWDNGIDSGVYKQISIDPYYWESANDSEREILIFHELGHCILGLDHSEYGIMMPSVMDYEEYEADRDHYLDVLYSRQ